MNHNKMSVIVHMNTLSVNTLLTENTIDPNKQIKPKTEHVYKTISKTRYIQKQITKLSTKNISMKHH